MDKKSYSTFDQIETELEILDIERQINYQKMILAVQMTKNHFTPKGIINDVFGLVKNIFSGSYSSLYSIIIPLMIKWVINKKRSH